MSLIFLIQVVGYGTTCLTGHYLYSKLGQHKLVVLGGCLTILCHVLASWRPPFAVFVTFLAFNSADLVTWISLRWFCGWNI